jgi:predicted RNA-binding Zn-ribbon protein involved in translation (DUF1610 family)
MPEPDAQPSDETAHTCPNCGYTLFDDDEEFVSGGGVAVSHSVDDGVFIEEHSCPECGHVLARNFDDPGDIRTDGGSLETVEGYPADQVEEGERIMESPITGETYRVTKWVEKNDGRAIALEKELVGDE